MMNVETEEHITQLLGRYTAEATVEARVEGPQNTQSKATIRPSLLLLCVSQEMQNECITGTPACAALPTTARLQSESRCCQHIINTEYVVYRHEREHTKQNQVSCKKINRLEDSRLSRRSQVKKEQTSRILYHMWSIDFLKKKVELLGSRKFGLGQGMCSSSFLELAVWCFHVGVN